ncbi:hypothetical protein ACN38_g7630 [Penicillium nordicum]|uniref:Uncharacterized protein n=1 Tax=Penicillium nordicum TaxID=229535 RepID=A0A0M8NYL9_9EURO|nr:hypothetical protein ACN38_g7630 [Penicillium nordicum]
MLQEGSNGLGGEVVTNEKVIHVADSVENFWKVDLPSFEEQFILIISRSGIEVILEGNQATQIQRGLTYDWE